ncbi:MAG: efflux RND transporter periplasmic adaptor subunit [Candidatus Omnitrophota bacterium]
MIKRKLLMYLLIFITIAAAIVIFGKAKHKTSNETTQEINPVIGNIQTSITATATVQPQNRLELKPPINGRLEKILVNEGDIVKEGQTLAWMSSTERAALLDAAEAKGEESVKYWEEVYKAAPLISPINGEVIVSKDYPGQTITSSDVVLVLSDHLIVQAQIDETDIGKVKIGQRAAIALDAYPKIKIQGTVNHIYYESETVNNVVIYHADILPENVPDVFRSGMSATVDIIDKEKENILLLPADAVQREAGGEAYVLIKNGTGKTPEKRIVETGISDDKNIEIISGLTENDKVLIITKKYKIAKTANAGTNPFMPARKKDVKNVNK